MDGEFQRECEEYGCDPGWMVMYEDMERQFVSGMDQKKHKKEKERLRKEWIKLNKKRVVGVGEPSWTSLSETLRSQEAGVRGELEELKGRISEAGWKDKRKLVKEQEGLEEGRRYLHQMTVLATALAKVREEVGKDIVGVPMSDKEREVSGSYGTQYKERGMYPTLPLDDSWSNPAYTSSPTNPFVSVPPPPSYDDALPPPPMQMPMMRICGKVACELEGETESFTPEERYKMRLIREGMTLRVGNVYKNRKQEEEAGRTPQVPHQKLYQSPVFNNSSRNLSKTPSVVVDSCIENKTVQDRGACALDEDRNREEEIMRRNRGEEEKENRRRRERDEMDAQLSLALKDLEKKYALQQQKQDSEWEQQVGRYGEYEQDDTDTSSEDDEYETGKGGILSLQPAIDDYGERRIYMDKAARGSKKPVKHPMVHRSTKTSKGKDPEASYMLPLIRDHLGLNRYEPFALRDTRAMVEKLPRICKDGGKWITQFLHVTQGQRVAMGDMRQAISGCAEPFEARRLEELAGTVNVPNEIPLERVATRLFEAIRATYPRPVDCTPTVLPYKMGTDPQEHYTKSQLQWVESTGRDPSKTQEAESLFRAALLAGLPEPVQETLKKDPDWLVGGDNRFKRHLIHHLKLYLEEKQKSDDKTKDMEVQLLKLQLAKAHSEAKTQKEKKKGTGDTAMMWQGQGRGGGQKGRGRGGYGGQGRGRGQASYPQTNCCYNCGAADHWKNECPFPPRVVNQGGYNYNNGFNYNPGQSQQNQMRGRGTPRGGRPWQSQAPPPHQPQKGYGPQPTSGAYYEGYGGAGETYWGEQE